jgi:superfamily II DNA or RNA helicase
LTGRAVHGTLVGMKARPYQIELDQLARDAIRRGKRAILLQLPTGGGKTFVGTNFMRGAEQKGNRSLFLAPRRELVYQTAGRLQAFGISPGIIMAGNKMDLHRLSQVASFDTLHARSIRRSKVPLPPAKIVIADEAHLTLSQTRRDILEAYPGAILIGLTATPAGPNGKPMGDVYDELVLGWPTRKMMDEGYLVEARYFAPSEPDLSKVKKNAEGDYQIGALERAMNKTTLIGDILENWMAVARDRRTVIFCVTREHAAHVCKTFCEAGIAAEYVDGETPKEKRAEIFRRVENGQTQVLVNVFVASYGLDIPPLDCCVIARPTKSLVLYLQMVGRVLRPIYAPGYDLEGEAEERLLAIRNGSKPDALIIDHSGCVREHGFVDDYIPWTLEGDENISDAKKREQQDRSEPKEIVCPNCSYVFKGSRICPACGHEAVRSGEDVPTYAAKLEEMQAASIAEGKAFNRKASIEMKMRLYGEMKQYAKDKKFNEGFAAHFYREVTGVWPNDPRIRDAPLAPVSDLVKGYVKWRGMKRRAEHAKAGRG